MYIICEKVHWYIKFNIPKLTINVILFYAIINLFLHWIQDVNNEIDYFIPYRYIFISKLFIISEYLKNLSA